MVVVKIVVVSAPEGFLATATDETGRIIVEWFHPVRRVAVDRTRADVRQKVPNAMIREERC